MNRRNFIRKTGLAAMFGPLIPSPGSNLQQLTGNSLPRWKGFNLLDFFSPYSNPNRKGTPEEYFKWMAGWGFDFVRIPIAYPRYLNIIRGKDISPDDVYKINPAVVDQVESLVHLAHSYQIHTSLNLHRAPGYCINAGFHEPFNLWKDEAAQEAFNWHWNMWASRFKNISSKWISFDLVNEPSMREDMNDQHSPSGPVPGPIYRKVILGAAKAIRKENPDHLIIADGNNVGNSVIPEIEDLPIAQSCRGYYPHSISHYRAPWANKDPDHMPIPRWPGQVGDQYLQRSLLEKYYQPWIGLTQKGIGVHCGECGCWNKTPHDVFLSWFGDVTDILRNHQIGFALWNFAGDFGILNSGRTDVTYENWYGTKLDRKLLNLLMKN